MFVMFVPFPVMTAMGIPCYRRVEVHLVSPVEMRGETGPGCLGLLCT